MRNLLINISFCGTNYHGFQIQKNKVTVQEQIQCALKKLLGYLPPIKGCSRTDSKVHAKEYFINFKTNSDIASRNILNGLNRYLPNDIVVNSIKEVNSDFHARYSSKGKVYEYIVLNSELRDPFLTDRVWHFKYKIDFCKLKENIKQFEGTYDFSSFCSSKSDIDDKTRTIYKAQVEKNGEFIIFTIIGNGFLHNMVRIMVGTLIEISNNTRQMTIDEIIKSKDRKKAGKTAPPQGLYLKKVLY